MKYKTIFIVISLFLQLLIVIKCATEQQCYDQIYRQCTHETTFTTKEIQTTQLYLRRRFSTTGPIRAACPISAANPPCIRKDIKCLSQVEIKTLTSAWVLLYHNGVVAKFTKIHSDYWGAEHKFISGSRWHDWFINQFEKELKKINSSICMPYWNVAQDFAHPKLSKVWDMFGHAGNASNDYCVPDGPFANVTCTFSSAHCLRRQWRISPLLDPFKSPEYHTMVNQMHFNPAIIGALLEINSEQTTPSMTASIGNVLNYSAIILDPLLLTAYVQKNVLKVLIAHFDIHLSCGGFNGDLSIPESPNDPLFHTFHIYVELFDLLWQLSNDQYLVPRSYNGGIVYNNITSNRSYANIDSDTFNYYNDVYVKEGFQFGYGEMCHLYDVIIKPINYIVNQNLLLEAKYPFTYLLYPCVPQPIPTPLPSLPTTATLPNIIRPFCTPGPLPVAAQRLKDCLSPQLFAKYYPQFASNNWSFFDHIFYSISGDCNPTNTTCRTMPLALRFQATPEGQRQYDAFNGSIADWDITRVVDVGQAFYEHFMQDLRKCGYCSPYV